MLWIHITHNAYYTVEMGGDLTRITLDNIHTAYKHICLQGTGCVCVKLPARNDAIIAINACNHRQCWKSNGATIQGFRCHYYIAWESNNAGEARGQSWDESLKSRWIPGGSCGYTSGTKRKHFAALSSPRPCWRWLQLQPSCGSPQWCGWLSNSSAWHSIPLLHHTADLLSRPCHVRTVTVTYSYDFLTDPYGRETYTIAVSYGRFTILNQEILWCT